MVTFPTDLHADLMTTLFPRSCRMVLTNIASPSYQFPVRLQDLHIPQLQQRKAIARLAGTCRALHALVKARLARDALQATSFFADRCGSHDQCVWPEGATMLKLYVVWIHRHRDLLKVR